MHDKKFTFLLLNNEERTKFIIMKQAWLLPSMKNQHFTESHANP
jgi:hypothetical protein